MTPCGTFKLGVGRKLTGYSILTIVVDGVERKYAIGAEALDVSVTGLNSVRIKGDRSGNVRVIASRDSHNYSHPPVGVPQDSPPPPSTPALHSGFYSSNHNPHACERCRSSASGCVSTMLSGGSGQDQFRYLAQVQQYYSRVKENPAMFTNCLQEHKAKGGVPIVCICPLPE